jgi:hypothetical protein
MKAHPRKEAAMCYKWEEEYLLQRAEEARKQIEKDAERARPKPAAPATPALEPRVRDDEPVPV